MKIYNLTGYLIIFSYVLACMYFAPAHLGPWTGLLIGGVYFIFCWFLGGLYLADVLHLGIAHRSLDYKEWFIKVVTVVNNVFGLYVDPIAWVNRHRLHHKHADHPGDPNKLSGDGFWRTFYLCVMPYRCNDNLAGDEILRSRTFRIVANPVFAIVAQAFSFYLFWKLVGDLKFVLAMWVGIRIFAQWVNMVQNYWTHTRTFGYRRYNDEDDNAMNIGEWLPVTATFSACFQNNHHHYPGLLRLSHDKSEYDFGFVTVKVMKYFGLVKATRTGEVGTQGRSIGRTRFLRRAFSFCKWFDRLPQKARRNFFAVQAVTFRPLIRIVVSSKQFIDPRKMNSKVLIDPLFLRGMVPMMISGHHQKLFEPFRIGTEIAMSPGRVKGDKNQIRQDDRLRKSKHERNKDKSAHQCVVYKVGA